MTVVDVLVDLRAGLAAEEKPGDSSRSAASGWMATRSTIRMRRSLTPVYCRRESGGSCAS